MFSWKSKELLLRLAEDIAVNDEVPLQVENFTEVSINDVEAAVPTTSQDNPSTLLQNAKHLSPVWYRNWSNVGLALCILYNTCIILLLVMGFFEFNKT